MATRLERTPGKRDRDAKAIKLERILKQFETEPPILLEKLIDKIERELVESGACREAKYELDIFPDWNEKPINKNITYKRKRQLDDLYCDGEHYNVATVYRVYEIDNFPTIVHSYQVDYVAPA
jgi:hypothetical protein